jgi:hypothetical protein
MMLAAIVARFALTQGMKGFLGKYGQPLLIAILIGLAVVFIDNRGFQRAKDQAERERLERAEITSRRRPRDRRSVSMSGSPRSRPTSTASSKPSTRKARPMFNPCSRARSSAIALSLILAAASLPACSPQLTRLEASSIASSSPAVPPPAPILDPRIRLECPPPSRVADGSPAAIASADAELALDYRSCSAKKEGAVAAFDALFEAYETLREAVIAGVKGGKNGK